ncbi:MAG: SulP family inorganic anion transporter [Vulcanimicrobiaceae bacterium]
MLAAIAIPEQLATAHLANMPPQTGLYAFAAGSLAFAVFGVNRFVSVGADSTIAPIFAGSIAALVPATAVQYPQFVGAVALFSGVLLVIAGVLRAGWIADLLSVPVTVGFLAGIAVHIVVAQLPQVLGIADPHGPLLSRLADILRHVPQANASSIAVGTAVCALALGAERISPRLPGALVGLVGAGIAAVTLHLSARGVALLGEMPSALPSVTFPVFDLHDALRLVPIAFIVALVCVMQTAAVVRLFPSEAGRVENPGVDFTAVGIGSMLAALLGAFAVDASPPRTAVVRESGGRSQLAGVAAVVAVAAVIVSFSRFTALLPQAALGGVLIYIGVRIFRIGDMLRIARHGGIEIWFVVAAALLVVVLPIQMGMALSIGLSLARGIYVVARPPSAELVHVRGTTIWWPPSDQEPGERVAGVVVFAPAAPITFTNVQYIAARLRAVVAAAPQPVQLVVIEAGGVIDVDYTGSLVFGDAIVELRRAGTDVALARLSDSRAQSAAERTGLLAAVGNHRVFKSVNEAVVAFRSGAVDRTHGAAPLL